MKSLKFKAHLADLILSGEKVVTWRLFDDKNLQEGDDVNFVNSETNEIFAKVKLTHITEKRLGEVTDEDYDGHEKYESKEEMLAVFKKYYGEKVTLEAPLKVIGFEVL